MNNFGLVLTINKYNTYFESVSYFNVYESLEDAKKLLVNTLVDHFKHINIDFPLELIDFEYAWFKEQYVKTNAFVYKIYSNDRWSEPWEPQDIYDDVLQQLENYEIENVPDFSKMYGEPNPDADAYDDFSIEHNEQTHEFEAKLKEIISQAQSVTIKEDEVKDCPCDKCQDGCKVQQMKRELEQENIKVNSEV